MRNTTEILGVQFDVLTMEEAVGKVMGFLTEKATVLYALLTLK